MLPYLLISCIVPPFRKGSCDANRQAAFRLSGEQARRLAAMMTAMSKEKVNFRALSVMDSGDRGTVRFVPEDIDLAMEVLQGLNVHYDELMFCWSRCRVNMGRFGRFVKSWQPSTSISTTPTVRSHRARDPKRGSWPW